jgi:iron complex transport system ATP-binding protein
MTALASDEAETPQGPMVCFEVEVRAVTRLSPGFVRITLGGECLESFDEGGELGPRDQRIKVIVPVGDGQAPAVTDLAPGWYPRWLARDPEERGVMRTYTVRAVRPAGPRTEVDIDFVLHVHEDGPAGPAAVWADAARPGDRVAILGPNRSSTEEYGGIEWQPPAVEDGPVQVLLAGDETAVPAIASILETLPSGYAGRAILEVPRAADFQELRSEADVEVTWLARGDTRRGDLLRLAVRHACADLDTPARAGAADDMPEVDVDDAILWDTPELLGQHASAGTPYVWIAGEAAVVRDLRRHLVGEAGLPRASVAFMGYWREGRAQ